MAGITPIPIARAKRTIATHFDLARRQQRIPVDLLARRCNMSIPTITKMLTKGDGSRPFCVLPAYLECLIPS